MKKIIPVLLTSVLLSGCASSILKSNDPPVLIYALRPSESIEVLDSKAKAAKILEVQRPTLPPGFDTARIAMYLEGGHRLDYYAGAKWTAPLDETLQEFTSQTVRKALPNIIVSSSGQAIDTNYRLQIRVNEFEPVYKNGPDQSPLLVASLSFTLLAMPDEKIVTNFTVEQQAVAQSNNLGAVTSGLEGLLQSVENKALLTIAQHIGK